MTKDVKTSEITLGNEITNGESDKFEIWYPAETDEDMLQEIQYSMSPCPGGEEGDRESNIVPAIRIKLPWPKHSTANLLTK